MYHCLICFVFNKNVEFSKIVAYCFNIKMRFYHHRVTTRKQTKMQKGVVTRGGVDDTRLEAKAKDKKKFEAMAKDSPSEDRPSRGQRQEYSRPRTKDTGAGAFQKKVFKFFFQAISTKKRSLKFFFRRKRS